MSLLDARHSVLFRSFTGDSFNNVANSVVQKVDVTYDVPAPSPCSLWPSPLIILPESSQIKNLAGVVFSPAMRHDWSPGGQDLADK